MRESTGPRIKGSSAQLPMPLLFARPLSRHTDGQKGGRRETKEEKGGKNRGRRGVCTGSHYSLSLFEGAPFLFSSLARASLLRQVSPLRSRTQFSIAPSPFARKRRTMPDIPAGMQSMMREMESLVASPFFAPRMKKEKTLVPFRLSRRKVRSLLPRGVMRPRFVCDQAGKKQHRSVERHLPSKRKNEASKLLALPLFFFFIELSLTSPSLRKTIHSKHSRNRHRRQR